MKELSPEVTQRLNALATHFETTLPQRIETIDRLEETAHEDEQKTRELRLRVHRLAGTASTFGMDALSHNARIAESLIERDLSDPDAGLRSDTREAIEAMKRSARNPKQSPVTDEQKTLVPSEQHDPRRLVITVGAIRGLPNDFDEQISVFGMMLMRADEPTEIREYIREVFPSIDSEEEKRDDVVESCIVLAEVNYFAEDSSRLRAIAKIRKEFPDRLQTILVGEEDDFQTRLRSVRYGADAFIPLPLDLSSLIDKLDATLKSYEDQPYHILVIDDDPEQVSDTALALQNAGMITSVVTDPNNIFRVLVEYKPELILMDMYMPECNGGELAAIIRQNENFVSIPIVFLSVETDAARQLEAIRSGADDFIVKPFDVDHLVTSIRIRAARTRAMRFYMERDSLTGLLNHTNLKQRLDHEMQRSRRIGTELVFAMIDIDKFKSVNDTYGHLTGDRVLKSLARLLVERLRRTDVVGRYGGEEFGIILFNTDAKHAERIMNEIRESFALIRQNNGEQEFFVTFSCGIAEFPRFETAQEINEASDNALYRAKEAGRNRVIIAGSDDA